MPWKWKPPLEHPRANLAAATCDVPSPGCIYAVGGLTTPPGDVKSTVEVYDTATATPGWSQINDMPTGRWGLAAASSPGLLHVLGGFDTHLNRLNTHEIYNGTEWSSSSTSTGPKPMPTARAELAAVTGPDGLIYAIGGADANENALPTVEAYDPLHDHWRAQAPMQTPRSGLAAVTGPDGLIYAIGGSLNGVELSSVEVFDPNTNTWTARPDLSLPGTGGAPLEATVGPNELIYVLGLFHLSTGYTCAVYSYDLAHPAAGWQLQDPLPIPRRAMGVATGADGLVYAIGGWPLKADIVADVDAYTPYISWARIPEIYGKLLGEVAADGGGWIVIGDHFIPVPPRSELVTTLVQTAARYFGGSIENPRLGEELRTMRQQG